MLYNSSISCHQEHALPTASEPCRLQLTHEAAAYGGVVLRFRGVSNLFKVGDWYQAVRIAEEVRDDVTAAEIVATREVKTRRTFNINYI